MSYNNKNYITENLNLKQQVINLKVANKDKAETIKAMKQELLEYNQLRDRFKILYEENQDFRYIFKAIKELGELRLKKEVNGDFTYYAIVIGDFYIPIVEEQYELFKEVLE